MQSSTATLPFVNPIDHCPRDVRRDTRTIDPLVAALNAKGRKNAVFAAPSLSPFRAVTQADHGESDAQTPEYP